MFCKLLTSIKTMDAKKAIMKDFWRLRFYISLANKFVIILLFISLVTVTFDNFILNFSKTEVIKNILYSIIAACIFHLLLIDFNNILQFEKYIQYVHHKIFFITDIIDMYIISLNMDYNNCC